MFARVTPHPAGSLKRALLNAGLAGGGTLVVGAAVFAALAGGSNAFRFGEWVVPLSIVMGIVGFAATWSRRTGPRRAFVGLTVAVLAIAAGIAAAVLGLGADERAPEALTAAESAPLLVVEEGGERRLRHPTFGFSVRHPGPGFVESAAVKDVASSDPRAQTYGFVNPGSASTLFVTVQKDMPASRAILSDHIDGMWRDLSRAARPGAHWVGKEIIWDDRRHVARLSATVGDTVHVEVAAYAIESPRRSPLIVDVSMMGADRDQLAEMLASFRP
jgi:hypothetical protein